MAIDAQPGSMKVLFFEDHSMTVCCRSQVALALAGAVIGIAATACSPTAPGGNDNGQVNGNGNDNTNDMPPATVPDFEAASFTDPSQIDNRYFPQPPGARRTYRETPDGTEEIIIEVLDDTRSVMGIACRVVRDWVYVDGVLIEDTHDWYAQDDDGNVWYMGEDVDNYNYDASGALLGITHEGAWEAGQDVDGRGSTARPGHQMKASPAVGDVYHQEYYAGSAEDMGEVIALDVPVTLRDDTTYRCLQTRDYTPLEPDVNEYKYYAPGIGLVLEQHVGETGGVELIEVE